MRKDWSHDLPPVTPAWSHASMWKPSVQEKTPAWVMGKDLSTERQNCTQICNIMIRRWGQTVAVSAEPVSLHHCRPQREELMDKRRKVSKAQSIQPLNCWVMTWETWGSLPDPPEWCISSGATIWQRFLCGRITFAHHQLTVHPGGMENTAVLGGNQKH